MNTNHELIIWSNKFACGLRLIDDQHRGLVDLINEMFNHVSGNYVQENNYFSMIIHEAVNYVKNHFSTEEKIILATKFPGYAEHKKEHENFIRTIIQSIHDYETGKRSNLLAFTRFLREWVLSHIALIDRQYFDYFKKIATRKADGSLSINLSDVDNCQQYM